MVCDKSTTCGKVSYGLGGLMLAVGGLLAILGVSSMGQAAVREYDCSDQTSCSIEVAAEQCNSQGENCQAGLGMANQVMIKGGSGDGKCATNIDKITVTGPDGAEVPCTASWNGCDGYMSTDDHTDTGLQSLCSFIGGEVGTYTVATTGENIWVYKPWNDLGENLAQGLGGMLLVAMGIVILIVGLLFALIPCCACKLPPAPAGGQA